MKFSSRLKFSDWPNRDLPLVAAGVYAIWNKDELIYCGMSGRDIENAKHNKKSKYGLITRLGAHASGRLSGNQFCVYVANRIVIPSLTPEQISRFESGELTLDTLTKKFIREHLEYQYAIVDSSARAYAMELLARNGTLFSQKPRLNPVT